jgi:hypothetical protein
MTNFHIVYVIVNINPILIKIFFSSFELRHQLLSVYLQIDHKAVFISYFKRMLKLYACNNLFNQLIYDYVHLQP